MSETQQRGGGGHRGGSGGRGGGAPRGGRGGRGGGAEHRDPTAAVHEAAPAVAPRAAVAVAAASAESASKGTGRVSEDFLTTDCFSTLPGLSPQTRQSMKEVFGYDRMTKVQSCTIPLGLRGDDVLAKAQTGTGKTIAFLIPAIERLVAQPPADRNAIAVLVLSPTRELALQIYEECESLIKFHRGLRALAIVGGTNMSKDVRGFTAGPLHFLIATPGRLLDHLANTPDVAKRLYGLKVLAIDEADRMLDMGFRPEVEKILAFLPAERQTLLFSATIPQEIVRFAPQILTPEFSYVEAASARVVRATATAGSRAAAGGRGGRGGAAGGPELLVADDPLATAAQVTQEYAMTSIEDQCAAVVEEIQAEIKNTKDFKIMAFFVTARLTQYYAELFNAMGINVLEIHSRKSQNHRMKTSDHFRDNANVVMFSSDVTARGMDYPDVTLVVQVGLPSDAEQYVHRLGRTGRAGKAGRGILFLTPDERFFLQKVKMLPVKERAPSTPADATYDRIMRARVPEQTKSQAYQAWLGFYNSHLNALRWTKESLVQRANYFATACLGCRSVPGLLKKTIGKMGLKGVPGLVIEEMGDRAARGGQPVGGRAPAAAPQQPRGGQRGAAPAPAAAGGYAVRGDYDDDDDGSDDEGDVVAYRAPQPQSRGAHVMHSGAAPPRPAPVTAAAAAHGGARDAPRHGGRGGRGHAVPAPSSPHQGVAHQQHQPVHHQHHAPHPHVQHHGGGRGGGAPPVGIHTFTGPTLGEFFSARTGEQTSSRRR